MVKAFFKGAAAIVSFMTLILFLFAIPWKLAAGLLLTGAFILMSLLLGLIIQQ